MRPMDKKRQKSDYRVVPCNDAFSCRVCGWPVGPEGAGSHRRKVCGVLHSNRVAADDNPALLMSLAVKPLAEPPFPLSRLKDLL